MMRMMAAHQHESSLLGDEVGTACVSGRANRSSPRVECRLHPLTQVVLTAFHFQNLTTKSTHLS